MSVPADGTYIQADGTYIPPYGIYIPTFGTKRISTQKRQANQNSRTRKQPNRCQFSEFSFLSNFGNTTFLPT